MADLVVCRCFLGIFEATFGAGAPYFLSMLYKRRELGFRMSLLLGMSPLANTFASSLAYGITHIKGSIAPWRLLFIIGNTTYYLALSPLPPYTHVLTVQKRARPRYSSRPSSTSSSSTRPTRPSS